MSVTFWLEKSDKEIKIPNLYFDKNEPEDPIYNPREVFEPIMPRVNLSNSNAYFILSLLFPKEDKTQIVLEDKWTLEKIELILKRIDFIILNIKETVPPSRESYVREVLKRIDKLCRYAIGLNDSILIA